MIEILSKIWLPLLVIILLGYAFGFSLFFLPFALVGFAVVEYLLHILTKDRLMELLKPVRQASLQP